MEIITLDKHEEDIINYMDIKNLEKGQAITYLTGTTDEIHKYVNQQQMGVVREAIKNGIATAVQRIICKTVVKTDFGLDKVNVYAYTVVRI